MRATWDTVVRWADCDPAGIAYHARIFDWFSEGRIAWLAKMDLDYYQIFRPRRIELLVLEAGARFHRPLYPGDAVSVEVAPARLSPVRMRFRYRVVQKSQGVAAEGFTEHAFVVDGRAVRLDRRFPEGYERLLHGALDAGGGFRTGPGSASGEGGEGHGSDAVRQ
ncbi:MAG: acyl-CoA thioesterase [Firmicutes bacterium]|nr:acyl-CoA thioesterase [Alicyclobacillaceae bacterium]MCL6496010.1 acyl-CoA thioesterase [Bacillota bacterium]